MQRIQRFIRELSERQWAETEPLRNWHIKKTRYGLPGEYVTLPGGEGSFQEDIQLDGEHGITYFLTKRIAIPRHWEPGTAGLTVSGGGEGLLRVNGASYQGIDRNHDVVPLYLEGVGLDPLLEFELFDPIPEPVDPLNDQAPVNPPVTRFEVKLVRFNKPVQQLRYSVKTACETMELLPEQDGNRRRLLDLLYGTMNECGAWTEEEWLNGERVSAAERRLADRITSEFPSAPNRGKMHMVGQSHIDIAWLWPVRETVRKVSRTFSTMTSLMEEYPDFVYSQSQPLLYAFVKEHDPALYAKIKKAVSEGRWELVGGMWVEPDLNIPSGESLVRQMLHGQHFYRDEFGKGSAIEWLPDTFGYCASLPQLLKLAGVDYFMTTKLDWNDTNKFPHELFNWVGIDGTSIVSYLNHGLNEHTRPKNMDEHWREFRQQDKLNELMLLYGHGDGGGGVTRDMVEFVQRSPLMPGLPAGGFSTAGAFFDKVGEAAGTLPDWHGDLYLELHRGTLTTHGRNKRSNRKAEVLYREAEIWASLARAYTGAEANADAMNRGWKLMLLNQFHDIIPGTAITETYETSAAEYEDVFALGGEALQASMLALAGAVNASGEGTPYVVFNSLGWERDETVVIEGGAELAGLCAYDEAGFRLPCDYLANEPGEAAEADGADEFGGTRKSGAVHGSLSVTVPAIPAFGYKTIWLKEPDAQEALQQRTQQQQQAPNGDAGEFDAWETAHYRLEFNARGEIVRWLDKAAQRELLPPGAKANELQFFHDKPTYWDAWDIDPNYEQQPAGQAELIGKRVVQSGDTADILRFEWLLGRSRITQDLILYPHRKRVDFKTRISWHESHKLLKAAFPIDIVSTKAAYEIPFGALERPTHRNTSWEQAQYEVCGHRWADISEGDYGVSLMNDCKYGYDIKGGVLRLSLLRAPKWPDSGADQGEHEFTYSLYPHERDWRNAEVVRRAAELNHPAAAIRVPAGSGDGSGESGHSPGSGSSSHSSSGSSSGSGKSLPATNTLLQLNSSTVILDTVKPAESGEGIVLRFYESTGSRDRIQFQLPPTARRASIVNLLEDELEACGVSPEGTVALAFKPFEIISIHLS
ncbi:alpha-mannosidase [Paenibacillus sacheonensis]|uniref:alpha-mannosidase n=1 Tax=Paenibacillus sacheonensis TaxID=742054 RepID=A0A7X5BZY1_9BACL|nr:alpha-mannosidase [Paenibacillus sacheonensis]MBM7566033.1 alpha-mannosidase [Paenibacillus sacheonensis]NBC68655.1 alpha-mannosidase [Paenibacillus sacheonensis]